MFGFKLGSLFLMVLLSFILVTHPAYAAQPNYLRTVTIHQVTHYPDHVDVHTTYETHIVSTESFLQNHKELVLTKEAEGNLYVVKSVPSCSPLASILSVLGVKGKELLNIEKATPVGQTPPFIQFEIDTFKA